MRGRHQAPGMFRAAISEIRRMARRALRRPWQDNGSRHER
jgi:hypothetical protein